MTDSDHSTLSEVTITTDGAARGNPGPGGWAALLESEAGRQKLLSGGDPGPTTNNAMELEAVIQALRALRRPCRIRLRCDSQYVLGGIERLLQGERFSETRKNGERWVALAELLSQHELRLEWVRGHNGDARNERVDRAANAAANGFALVAPPDLSASQGPQWSLALLAPGATRPARWALRAGDTLRQGEIAGGEGTQATAVYRALLAGLAVAAELPGAAEAILQVSSNFELLIKQSNGEWRVKNPAQQPLAVEAARLRVGFGGVRFGYEPAEVLEKIFEE
jgi:ribonuclease HI